MELEEAITRTPVLKRGRYDVAGQALVGSRCRDCAVAVWPARAVCFRCGSSGTEETRFARTGQLRSMTRVHVARPGLETPYLLGQVLLDDRGPEIFGRVVGVPVETTLPTAVEVAVGSGTDGTTGYWFTAPDDG